jgi:hypothetical protein
VKTVPWLQAQTQRTPQQTEKSIEQLRNEIRENVRQQLEKAARETRVQGVQGVPPSEPLAPVAPLPSINGPTTYTSAAPWEAPGIPPQVVDISIAFFFTVAAIIIGLPLARAFARRMDRRGGQAQIPGEVADRLNHLSQAVDAIALEVERISEGQRFTTRLLSEQRNASQQSLSTGSGR